MTVGIVGLGLIGGSIGLALRDPCRRVLGFDRSPENARLAQERFCVDEIADLERVAVADVVFVAVPPTHVVAILEKIAELRGESTVVTDCTSVKGEVAEWALRRKASWFVPGHPMAGHEKSGPGFASAWMFRNARWILTPNPQTDRASVRSIEALVKAMGAVPVVAESESHDRQVAILSHLPHVLAAVLVQMADDLDRTDIAGGSWRDLTRVGGADPDLWTQIFFGNRRELAQVVADAEDRLQDLRQALENDDAARVREILNRARIAKKKQEA